MIRGFNRLERSELAIGPGRPDARITTERRQIMKTRTVGSDVSKALAVRIGVYHQFDPLEKARLVGPVFDLHRDIQKVQEAQEHVTRECAEKYSDCVWSVGVFKVRRVRKRA